MIKKMNIQSNSPKDCDAIFPPLVAPAKPPDWLSACTLSPPPLTVTGESVICESNPDRLTLLKFLSPSCWGLVKPRPVRLLVLSLVMILLGGAS